MYTVLPFRQLCFVQRRWKDMTKTKRSNHATTFELFNKSDTPPIPSFIAPGGLQVATLITAAFLSLRYVLFARTFQVPKHRIRTTPTMSTAHVTTVPHLTVTTHDQTTFNCIFTIRQSPPTSPTQIVCMSSQTPAFQSRSNSHHLPPTQS